MPTLRRFSNSSRHHLLLAVDVLLKNADIIQSYPEISRWICSLQESHHQLIQALAAREYAISTHSRLVKEAEEAEKRADQTVVHLHQWLQMEGQRGDMQAVEADQMLFPKGVTEIVRLKGNSQMIRYQVFASQLQLLSFSSILQRHVENVQQEISRFTHILKEKNTCLQEKQQAIARALQAEQALEKILQKLDLLASLHLPPEVFSQWTRGLPAPRKYKKSEIGPEAAAPQEKLS